MDTEVMGALMLGRGLPLHEACGKPIIVSPSGEDHPAFKALGLTTNVPKVYDLIVRDVDAVNAASCRCLDPRAWSVMGEIVKRGP